MCNIFCLVPRPHYYARAIRFWSRGPRKFLRLRQTRRSETLGAFHLGKKPGNFGGSKSGISDW